MNPPKKIRKQPDLKRRLEQVVPSQEQDVVVTVALPPSIYRAIEAMAGSDVEGWVRAVVIDAVEGEFAADELLDQDEPRTDS